MQSSEPRGHLGLAIIEGLRYVNNDVALRSLLLVASVLNFCITGPMSVGLAFLAKREFRSPSTFGFLISAVAAGSLIGMLLAAARQQRRRGLVLLTMSAVVGLCTVAVGLFHQVWSLVTLLVVMGASAGFLNVHLFAWFQERVDVKLLGRVMSVLMFASVGLVPLSLVAAGAAVAWSLRAMFAGAGGLILIVTLVAASQAPVRHID